MPTWNGWIIQFLNGANILNTPPNQTFMSEWANHAPGTCKNNPVDLSKAVSGSTRCGDTVAGFGRTQNYPTHAAASNAFGLSIDSQLAAPIKAALNTGNPFQIQNRDPVVAALKAWGSPTFANWYQNATAQGTTGGSGGSSGRAPHFHSGYRDLQHTWEHNLPNSLRKSGKLTDAALRSLSHGRKVKR